MAGKVSLRKQAKFAEGMPSFETHDIDLAGFKGTLPFDTAAVLNDDGTDELPDEVRRTMNDIVNTPIYTPDVVKATSIKPPEPIKFDELDADKQAEILAAIQQTAERPRTVKKQEPVNQFIPRHPSIGQAKQLADKVAKEAEQRTQAAQQRVVPPADPEQEIDTPVTTKSADVSVTLCTHCGWPVNQCDLTDPTKLDKQIFVASILGQKRFYKTYELLGGQLRVTFRSLTIQENDIVIVQLVEDWNSGKLSGPAHSVAEATKYQLAMSLHSIETSVGPITLPTLDDYEYDAASLGKNTILPDIVTYVNEKALINEPLRRIVSKAYGHFIETVSKLEAMAETSDFWLAIEE